MLISNLKHLELLGKTESIVDSKDFCEMYPFVTILMRYLITGGIPLRGQG